MRVSVGRFVSCASQKAVESVLIIVQSATKPRIVYLMRTRTRPPFSRKMMKQKMRNGKISAVYR